MTGNPFKEVFRKNNGMQRTLAPISETRNTVRELRTYNNRNLRGTFLCCGGNFDRVNAGKWQRGIKLKSWPMG
ncbi:MAG TPA: hypothetical protein VKN36_15845 [Eudoraea sp.]|nr:hypothetical protein [Eudoraea sp.]